MKKHENKAVKIVTVEDSPIVAARLRTMLIELNGIEHCGNATHIAQALELIIENRPAVVILDIHLKADAPVLNGIDLLKLIRYDHPAVSIVILSNFSDEQYRTKCLALGARYFLDKTNDFDKIPETLNLIISSQL